MKTLVTKLGCEQFQISLPPPATINHSLLPPWLWETEVIFFPFQDSPIFPSTVSDIWLSNYTFTPRPFKSFQLHPLLLTGKEYSGSTLFLIFNFIYLFSLLTLSLYQNSSLGFSDCSSLDHFSYCTTISLLPFKWGRPMGYSGSSSHTTSMASACKLKTLISICL